MSCLREKLVVLVLVFEEESSWVLPEINYGVILQTLPLLLEELAVCDYAYKLQV